MNVRMVSLLLFSLLLAVPTHAVEQFRINVLERKAQDPTHYVQGLEIHDGLLYVSTGRYGQSRLLRYDLASGERQVDRRLNPRLFGEGLTLFGDRIYQLTWREGMLLEFSRDEMKALAWHPIPGQGWGLTNDGKHLIYTDGGDKLHYMDPDTKRILRSVPVTENGTALPRINELEWIDNKIWANVYPTDRIVIIDPKSGEVTASIDLKGLFAGKDPSSIHNVLNGIARNPDTGDIWVTGKLWPWMYRIELVPVQAPSPATESR